MINNVKLPRWWFRCAKLLREYDKLLQLKQNSRDIIEVYAILKKVFVSYWQIIYDLYKEKNITINYPVDMFNKAQEDGLIEDKEIWLEFIKWTNSVLIAIEPDKEKELKAFLIEKFFDKLDRPVKFARRLLDSKPCDLIQKELIFSQELQRLDNEKFKIDKEFCDDLLNFFKEHEEINKVWLFGSRINGLCTPRSDIDMFIDSPIENMENLHNELNSLNIPYHFDFKNIHDESAKTLMNNCLNYTKYLPVLVYDRVKMKLKES